MGAPDVQRDGERRQVLDALGHLKRRAPFKLYVSVDQLAAATHLSRDVIPGLVDELCAIGLVTASWSTFVRITVAGERAIETHWSGSLDTVLPGPDISAEFLANTEEPLGAVLSIPRKQ